MQLKIIKKVNSSTPHKKKQHSTTFIYQPILMKMYMNANIVKTQIYLIMYDLRGH